MTTQDSQPNHRSVRPEASPPGAYRRRTCRLRLIVGLALALAASTAQAGIKTPCLDDDDNAPDYTQCQGFKVTAEEEYLDEAADVRVVFRRSEVERRGALISINGFGLDDYAPCASKSPKRVTANEQSSLAKWTDAWKLGYDLYSVTWCKPYDYVQRNAFGLEEVLTRIDAGEFSGASYDGPDDRTLVVAKSMGGVVARYAMTSLERDGFVHGVDEFISFDSPQRGAYLPIGVQFATEWLEDLSRTFRFSLDEDAQKALDGKDVPAAKQLLLIHHSTGGSRPTTLHEELYGELDDLGYPQENAIRNVAISNGSGAMALSRSDLRWDHDFSFGAVDETFTVKFPKNADDPLWSAKIRVTVSGPLAFTIRRLEQTDQDFDVFRATYKTPSLQINGTNVSPSIFDLADILGVPDFVPADSLLKPYVQDIKNLYNTVTGAGLRFDEVRRVNVPYAYDLAGGGTSEKVLEFQETLKSVTEGVELKGKKIARGIFRGSVAPEVFVPTTSAIGLVGDPTRDVTNLPASSTPFDHFYLDSTQKPHNERSPRVEAALCKEAHELIGLPYVGDASPRVRPQGGTEFTITVRGGNFTPGSVVVWNDPSSGRKRTVELATTFQDDQTLEALVPEELIENLTECTGNSDAECQSDFAGFLPPTPRKPIKITVIDDGSSSLPARVEQDAPSCQWGGADFEILDIPLEIDPRTPTPFDEIEITYAEDWRDSCVPELDRFEVRGSTIDVDLKPREGLCLFAVRPFETKVVLPPQPAGSYELRFRVQSRIEPLIVQTFNVRYPQPIAQALHPRLVSARSPELVLTVTGEDFVDGLSTVLWNGAPRETRFVDETTLVATVLEGDLASPTEAQVTVLTDDPLEQRESEALTFTVGLPIIDLYGTDPERVPAGSPTRTIRLLGEGFTRTTAVEWDSGEATVSLPIRYVGYGELELTLDARLMETAGTSLLTAFDGNLISDPLAIVVEAEEGGGGPTGSGTCTALDTRLCLNGARFGVRVDWETRSGERGVGQVTQLTSDTGYVWFFDEDNVELVVKVLDACALNQRTWVFLGGLTDVAVEATVTDTVTGEQATYRNPQGVPFAPQLDTSALGGCDESARGSVAIEASEAAGGRGPELQLNEDRFRVTADWTARNGAGAGEAVELTGDTGYFWFFDAANVEVVVKVLDACAINGHYWVFAGGLTDVDVELEVRDGETDEVVVYRNRLGNAFQPIQDTTAFRCDLAD